MHNQYTQKKTYSVAILGCDDATVFRMELTDDEREVVDRLCSTSQEVSSYGCMPVVVLTEIRHDVVC